MMSTRPKIRSLDLRAASAAALVMVALSGCSTTTLKHGHQFGETDLQQIQPGMTQDAVRTTLGTPDTTSSVSGNRAFYYISSTNKQTAFFKEQEVDRKVVAVYFGPAETVDRIAHYGLKDGQIVDFSKGETQAYMRDKGFLAKFFRGVGAKQKIIPD